MSPENSYPWSNPKRPNPEANRTDVEKNMPPANPLENFARNALKRAPKEKP